MPEAGCCVDLVAQVLFWGKLRLIIVIAKFLSKSCYVLCFVCFRKEAKATAINLRRYLWEEFPIIAEKLNSGIISTDLEW